MRGTNPDSRIWTKKTKQNKKKGLDAFAFCFFFSLPPILPRFEITPVMGWAAVALPSPISRKKFPQLCALFSTLLAARRRAVPACWADDPGGVCARACVNVWWHRLCSRARLWLTCSSGTAGWTGSGGSSSASGERRRSSSRSGLNGRTGTFYTCTGVTPTWVACSKDCWNLSQRTGETCLKALRLKVGIYGW